MNIPSQNSRAAALIKGENDTANLIGKVEFFQKSNCVLVSANIKGLPKNDSGFYGFHIHEGDSCAGKNFANTGGHYNPNSTPHPNHAGDMPPLISCQGNAYLQFTTDRFSIKDIIGKTVVIHSNQDDFTTQSSGNAGTKIACGVIKNRLN